MRNRRGQTFIAGASDDPRRARILDGALKMFLAYGFDRTTMDHIARAAELSRPALYLVFRNKTDIYRALAHCVLAEVTVKAREALSGDGALLRRLDDMVHVAFFDTLTEIEESPHGPELIDMQNALAGDVCAEWREKMGTLLEETIAAEAAANGVDLAARGLSPRALADVFLDSLEGMRVRLSDPRSHLDAARTSARVLVAALRP